MKAQAVIECVAGVWSGHVPGVPATNVVGLDREDTITKVTDAFDRAMDVFGRDPKVLGAAELVEIEIKPKAKARSKPA